MNLPQFDAALSGLVNTALQNGVAQGKMDVHHVISSLELVKLALVRNLQDATKEQQGQIIKVNRLPPTSMS